MGLGGGYIRITDPEVFHKIAKYFLVFIHVIFFLCGTVVTGLSIYALVDWQKVEIAFLTNSTLPNFALGGIVVGCILIVFSLFGVVAAVSLGRCMLVMNSLCILMLALLFACLGASVFIVEDRLNADVIAQSGELWFKLESAWLRAASTDQGAICRVMSTVQCTGFANSANASLGGSPKNMAKMNLQSALYSQKQMGASQVRLAFFNLTPNPNPNPQSHQHCRQTGAILGKLLHQ